MGKIAICFIAMLAIGISYAPYADCNPLIGSVEVLLKRITDIVGSLLSTVSKLLCSVDSLLNKLLDQVLNNLLGGLLNSVGDLLGNLLGGGLLGGGDHGGKGGLLSGVGGLLGGVGDLLDGVLKGLGPLLNAVLKLVGDLLKLVGKLLGRKSLLEEILGATENLVKETLEKIAELTKGYEKDPNVIGIVQCATSDLTFCTNSLLNSVTSEMGLIEGLLETVSKLVNGLVSSLSKCLAGELGNLGNCLKSLLDEVTEAVENIGKLLGLDDANQLSGLLTEVNCCVNNVLFNLISGLGSLGVCNDVPRLCCEEQK